MVFYQIALYIHPHPPFTLDGKRLYTVTSFLLPSPIVDVDVDTHDAHLPGLDLLHHGVGPALDLRHRLHHPTQSLFKLNLLKGFEV